MATRETTLVVFDSAYKKDVDRLDVFLEENGFVCILESEKQTSHLDLKLSRNTIMNFAVILDTILFVITNRFPVALMELLEGLLDNFYIRSKLTLLYSNADKDTLKTLGSRVVKSVVCNIKSLLYEDVRNIRRTLTAFPDLSKYVWCKENDINVKMQWERSRPSVASICSPKPGVFVLADWRNECVKVIDTSKSSKMSREKFGQHIPWVVCALPSSRVAVSCLYGGFIYILMLSSESSISIVGSIDAHHGISGSAFADKQMYISFFNSRVKELSSARRINLDFLKFNDAMVCYQLAASYSNQHAALSRLASYPTKMTDDGRGQIIVCCPKSKDINLINRMDGSVKTILRLPNDFKNPTAIEYCPVTRYLVIGGSESLALIYRITI